MEQTLNLLKKTIEAISQGAFPDNLELAGVTPVFE